MRARTQLTVAATAVAALLVALTGQFLVWRTDHQDRADLDRALSARAAQIATDATKTGKLPADGVYVVRLMSGNQVRAQSGSTLQFSATVNDGYSTVPATDRRDYRSWAETLKTGVQLQVLTSLTDIEARHSSAVRLVDLSVLVAILLGGLATWFASGVVLRPLRRLQDGARELRPDDLSGRLPSVTEPREVAEVAASVNALLDRMQALAGSTADRPAATGPALAPPAVSTITPPPAVPDMFPPRALPPAPEAAAPKPAANGSATHEPAAPAAERDDEALRDALAKLGDDLDTLLDNPELSATQRHLILASVQNEYRRIVLLMGAGDTV
jgi:HAMP domain-containing protein